MEHITAQEARQMTLHEGDIFFGLWERCYAEVTAAALNGQVGIIFKYPAEFIGCKEFLAFTKELNDNGFVVFEEKSVYSGVGCMGVYWGPFETL